MEEVSFFISPIVTIKIGLCFSFVFCPSLFFNGALYLVLVSGVSVWKDSVLSPFGLRLVLVVGVLTTATLSLLLVVCLND